MSSTSWTQAVQLHPASPVLDPVEGQRRTVSGIHQLRLAGNLSQNLATFTRSGQLPFGWHTVVNGRVTAHSCLSHDQMAE
jgi:hypothetical protein